MGETVPFGDGFSLGWYTRVMEKMKTNSPAPALSLMPAFFAAGCCATAPLMVMFGFAVGETALGEYRWLFRLGGLLIFVLSLWWYFNKQGVRSLGDYRNHQSRVLVISVHTALYTLVIYAFLVWVAAPFIWQTILEQAGSCCGY